MSALQVADRESVVVFNTLSKRSSMTGYRSGFVAASAAVCDALRKFRPTVGTAPQEFVQRASVAAWSDDAHVDGAAPSTGASATPSSRRFVDGGLRLVGERRDVLPVGRRSETSEAFARRMLEHGIVVAPGSFFGPAGDGYARFALVPTQAECERAAEILRAAL